MQSFYGLLFVISLYELAGIYLSDLQMVTLVSLSSGRVYFSLRSIGLERI